MTVDRPFPWWLVALAAYGLALAVRHWLALGGFRFLAWQRERVTVSLTEPYDPRYQDVGTAQNLLLRIFWPRLRYTIGVDRGNLKLPLGISDAPAGLLLTMRRNFARRLEVVEHATGDAYEVNGSRYPVPVGDLQFEVGQPEAAPAGEAADSPPKPAITH